VELKFRYVNIGFLMKIVLDLNVSFVIGRHLLCTLSNDTPIHHMSLSLLYCLWYIVILSYPFLIGKCNLAKDSILPPDPRIVFVTWDHLWINYTSFNICYLLNLNEQKLGPSLSLFSLTLNG
jgi:hypothetical protein